MASPEYERFMASTEIDYDRWKEGEGYDLAALGALAGVERLDVEQWLFDRAGNDWRDLEALVAIGSDRARAAVLEQLRRGSTEQRLWAAHYLVDDPLLAADREAAVVRGLEQALLYGGLSLALDMATEERTPAMIDALFRAALRDEGEAAIHAAARLAYIHGKAKEPFDWELRPLFLRFGEDRPAREAAFRELCALIGVDPAPYLAG
jgi:hypothetical protein